MYPNLVDFIVTVLDELVAKEVKTVMSTVLYICYSWMYISAMYVSTVHVTAVGIQFVRMCLLMYYGVWYNWHQKHGHYTLAQICCYTKMNDMAS